MVTNDVRCHERAVRMHDVGQVRAFHAEQFEPRELAFCGDQYRMSELTGAVALAQLRKVDQIRAHCREMSLRLRERLSDLPGIAWRQIPDPEGESGIETYFWVKSPELRDAFRKELVAAQIPCEQMTGTYAQYHREYVKSGLAHTPGASPFGVGEDWPGVGYRVEDFPQTESLVHRFVVIPVGMKHTLEDMDHISAVVRTIHAQLQIA